MCVDGNICRVATESDGDAASLQIGLGWIECVPAISNIGLEPGVQIHRFKPLEVAHDHTSRYRQRSTTGYAQMGHVSTDAITQLVQFGGTDDLLSTSGRVSYRVANIIDNRVALIVTGSPSRCYGSRHFSESVRFAISAWIQEREGFIGQLLYLDERRPGSRVGNVSGFDINGCAHGERPGWCNQSLAQVAIHICEFDRRNAGRQDVLFSARSTAAIHSVDVT